MLASSCRKGLTCNLRRLSCGAASLLSRKVVAPCQPFIALLNQANQL